MIPVTLPEILKSFGILVAVIALIETNEKFTYGDRALLESDYLLRIYFDDLSASEISQYLEGKLLPQLGQQGRVCCIICMPKEGIIVGLFYHDDSDINERYVLSKNLDTVLRDLWRESI